MGKSIPASSTGTVYPSPCKLLQVIVKPSSLTGSFELRDGGASGRIIVSDDNIPANGHSYNLPVDHDCKTDLYATISNCTLYCIIR